MTNESNVASDNIEPLIISFYTRNTPYEQEVENLIRSCQQWGLDYCIEGKKSQGSWEKNCGIKPHFILEKLEERKRPVLWVDADAAFLQKPDFQIFQSCDFSVRIFPGLPRNNPSKVMSGTIYVNYTPEGLDLVRRWGKNCKKRLQNDGRVWDQYVLRELVLREKKAKVFPLPVSYCKIYDLDILFVDQENVVIEHYQASRRLKDVIC